jgi:hypothetical protein
MFNIMSLRHHWTKNFSIPALFMPRLLAITAFPGPGIVFVKEYCDSLEKKFRLLKKRVVIDSSMPSELPKKGLDAMRQWYLYQEIQNVLQQVHSISLQISDIQHPLSLNWT